LNGKSETQQTTSRINDLTKKLKDVTRKTMSKVSELAMHQSQAISLYQEKIEKVTNLNIRNLYLLKPRLNMKLGRYLQMILKKILFGLKEREC
jgi:hypothetical protein